MSFLNQILNTIRKHRQTTHSRTNQNTSTFLIDLQEGKQDQNQQFKNPIRVQSKQANADLRNLREILKGKVSILEGLLAGDNAVAEAIVESPVVFAVDVALGAEPADLAGEPGRELGGVEPVDLSDTTLAGEKLLVVTVDVVAEDGGQTHARYHDPLLRVLLSLGRGGGDGGGHVGHSLSGVSPFRGGIGGFAKRVEG